MSVLALSLLGSPRIERDGVSVHVSRRKAVALLAYLGVTGRPHRRDALAAMFWPEHDQRGARAGLRRAVAALKEALGEGWLDSERETVGLDRDAEIGLDVRAFRERAAGCGQHEHPREEVCSTCLSLLAEAVALYRDDFLAGFTLRDSPGFDDWQFFQTQGLRDELASALERLVEGHGARGEFEQAIAYARRWLALDPLYEVAHRSLMQLYAWSGRRVAALRQYGECERVLQEELGASPGEETVQFYRAIVERRELPAPAERPSPALPRAAPRRHNLPAQVFPFVGREAALAEIGERLEDEGCRLLTLVGPGGSGKTRLALQAAAGQLDRYADGVFFISLAPLSSADGIVPTIAEALGLSFYREGEPRQQLLDYLRRRSTLLILDNYEHLLDGAALTTEILEAAPGVRIVVTSRARLNVQGEYLYPITGMGVPASALASSANGKEELGDPTRYSAVQLFLTSARRAQAHFAPTEQDLADIVRICRLVEGMPLGILLAAAWGGTLTPAEIASEIEASLDFLEVDWRDVPARQRSMRAAFDHSWNLLGEREREVFAALSVFRGGFVRGAAQRVVGASLRELTSLASKSLLHHTPDGRYGAHELLRQYAAEKLAASPDAEQQVRDRHCAYYATSLQGWEVELKGSRQLTTLDVIEVEIGNVRAAWDRAAERGYVEQLDRAMDGLCRFYEWRGRYEEGEAACRATAEALAGAMAVEAVSPAREGPRVRAKATAWLGAFCRAARRLDQAKRLLGESLVHLEALASAGQEVRQERAFASWQMGYALFDLGAWEEAGQQYERGLALYRALGDRWGTAAVLYHLADLVQCSGCFDEAEALVREGLAIQRDLGDHKGTAGSLRVLGVAVIFTGEPEESERLTRESVAAFRAMGDRAHAAEALINLGFALAYLGRLHEARSRLEESVAIYSDLGFSGSSSSQSVGGLGWVDLLLGRYEAARERVQRGLALARERGYRFGEQSALLVAGQLAIAEGEYAQAQQLLPQARSALPAVGYYYTALTPLAHAALGLGQRDRARRYLCEASRWMRRRGATLEMLDWLPVVALLLADLGEAERAVELYALASRYPYVANSQWYEDVAGRHIAAAAEALPPDVVAAAQERGRARDLDATVKELLAEFEGAAN